MFSRFPTHRRTHIHRTNEKWRKRYEKICVSVCARVSWGYDPPAHGQNSNTSLNAFDLSRFALAVCGYSSWTRFMFLEVMNRSLFIVWNVRQISVDTKFLQTNGDTTINVNKEQKNNKGNSLLFGHKVAAVPKGTSTRESSRLMNATIRIWSIKTANRDREQIGLERTIKIHIIIAFIGKLSVKLFISH